MSVASENLSLPPNVVGKARGFVDVVIESLTWKTSKTFSDVKLKLLWWGQKRAFVCEGIKIDFNKRAKIPIEPLKEIQYQVKTNLRLFQEYLKNCEALKIDVYSTKTGDFIGSSELRIPQKLHSNKTDSAINCRATVPILSCRHFVLGEIAVTINVQQFDMMTQKTSIKEEVPTLTSPKRSKSIDKKILKEKVFNKENIEVVGKKKKISFRDPKPSKPSTLVKDLQVLSPRTTRKSLKPILKSSELEIIEPPTRQFECQKSHAKTSSDASSETSSLINYLSGVPMSRVEQVNALHDLVTLSPSQSIIDGLDRVDVRQKPAMKPKVAEKIDSVRIVVSQVELNSAGQLEVQSYINKNRLQKFILKCVITSKCFKSSEDVRILSPVFETAPHKIRLDKEITQRITFTRSKTSIFVNFGFCMKPIDQQTSPFFVGFSRVDLAEIVNSMGTFHKKCPIINDSDMRIGTVTVKMDLGVNELHFGRQLIDSLYSRRENVSVCSDDSFVPRAPLKLVDQKVQTKSRPSHSNDQCDSERNYENKNVQTENTSSESRQVTTNARQMEDKDTEMVDVEKEANPIRSKVYQGLLFFEGLRNVKDQSTAEYFMTYEGFWNDCQESTEISYDNVFNYLKQFPVICDDSFLKRVQNNHLELKLWEKTDRSEKWIGSTKLPLHQFFIAFRDIAMIEHLSTNQLPIISIDTWSNFISPLSSELFCQGKVLLAIGSVNQIEYLKALRNLYNLPMPSRRKSAVVQAEQAKSPPASESNAHLKNKLTAFIESLSQKLPEPSVMHNCHKAASIPSTVSSPPSSAGQPQLRKTSELLESLQKALSQSPPVAAEADLISHNHHQSAISDSSISSLSQERVQMVVTIAHASHLPTVVKKKQNRRKNKNATTPQKTEFEPSSYVTFESCLDQFNGQLPENVVKSHEGLVHCTAVIKSCDPQWNQSFNAEIPLDVITNPQKRFVIKVWRKASPESELRAAPFEDAVIGFSAIDLSVLLTGLPILSGFYNIMDFSGRCNGQINLSVKPLENLSHYQDSSTSLPPLMNPLNIDVSVSDDSGSTLLSRTLKRKFTELDEITQRLKARLFDVTGDENFDPEEEFERDLNTVVDEMDDGDDQPDFAWLKNDSNGNISDEPMNDFQSQLNRILEPQPSTSKSFQGSTSTITGQRVVSGCSNENPHNPPPLPIDQLLKKYDLDTLINPSIFKNIMDPHLANSDSTPTLNPQPLNTDSLANVSGDSGDTTVSSILSVDQVQTIQKALQKATIGDASEQSSSRKDPDGENNISE